VRAPAVIITLAAAVVNGVTVAILVMTVFVDEMVVEVEIEVEVTVFVTVSVIRSVLKAEGIRVLRMECMPTKDVLYILAKL
jgi:hypothetical protein